MEIRLPITEQANSLPNNQPTFLEVTPKAKKEPVALNDARSLESSPSVTDVITIPSCSRWFSWDKVHESERRNLPEFFDERSPLKNTRTYMYYRNSIVKFYRENPSRKITFTQVRKVLVGDVGSIRRVYDFLEGWGLINYTGVTPKPHSKSDDKENRHDASLSKNETSTRFCIGCNKVCAIACFVCDKLNTTLCARCYVGGDYRVNGASIDDFRRVEISEQTKTDWSEKETLNLLEATMHYGDDWKKVAEHVGGRSEKECVARFIKLPFKEQFIGPQGSEEVNKYAETGEESCFPSSPAKKRRLTPFGDTSNPIMAQVAFLSAMVGSRVADAAARAAVEALSGSNLTTDRRCLERIYTSPSESASDANGGDTMSTLVDVVGEAHAQIQKEELDVEKSITRIVEVEMKEVEDKIVHFEEVELQMEREWKQLHYMKSLLFADELSLSFQSSTTPLAMGEGAKTPDPVT